MKTEEEIDEEIEKVKFDLDHTQEYDPYKYLEGVLVGLKVAKGEISEQECPECKEKLVSYALPSDDSGHPRMMCPKCGAWYWKGE